MTSSDRPPRSAAQRKAPRALAAFATVSCVAALAAAGCAEVEPATTADAEKLANLRADLEQNEILSKFQQKKKEQARARGEDADALYDDAEPLKKSDEFQRLWAEKRKLIFEDRLTDYKKRPGRTIQSCIVLASTTGGAREVDTCVQHTQPDEKINPLKAAIIAVVVLIAGVAALTAYRSARRRIDTVAVAGKQLGLNVTQGDQNTTVTGKYKDQEIKIESSAPESGQGDRFMRVIVLSNINPKTVVRFGPLAPPTGLDLPDLDAPEVHDDRIPEGYKLRLSEGTSASELLSGETGFQLRQFDPVDVRVHDGVCGVTCWQIPATADKVIEFIDVSLAAAKLYS